MKTPQEIIEESKSIHTFAPRTIHDSYFLFLQFFSEPLSEEKIMQGAYMVYGWMPTMLRIKGPKKLIIDLAEAGKNDTVSTQLLAACASVLNNSLVGTTKLLHFINPKTYPIWDSRVYRALFREKPYRYRVEQPKAYMGYLNWITKMEQCPDFHTMKTRFEQEAGYPVSNTRAGEATLYTLGHPSNH